MHRPKRIFVADTFKYSVRLINLTAEHCICPSRVACCECFCAELWPKHRLGFFQALLPTLDHGSTAYRLNNCDSLKPMNDSEFSQFLDTFITAKWAHSTTDRLNVPIRCAPLGRIFCGAW